MVARWKERPNSKKLKQKMILGSTTIFGLKVIGSMCPSYTLSEPCFVSTLAVRAYPAPICSFPQRLSAPADHFLFPLVMNYPPLPHKVREVKLGLAHPTVVGLSSGVVHRSGQSAPPLEPALWLCALPVIRLVALRNHCCREPQANICLSSKPQIH